MTDLSLTADHGVIEIPEHREEVTGRIGVRISPGQEAEFVARAEAAAADSMARLFEHSRHEGRATGPLVHLGVEVLRECGHYRDRYPQGTGHGTPWLNDRAVPLVFLGSGLDGGLDAGAFGDPSAPATVADLVPTLGELAGLPVPDGLDGRSLLRER